MAMAESDGKYVPWRAAAIFGIITRGNPAYGGAYSAGLIPHHGLLIKYQLVFAYQTYTKYSNPQGLPSSVDSSPVFNITMFPPNRFHLQHIIASYNDPDLFTGCYCHGDPGSWAPLFPSRDATVDELNDWEIMVSEREFADQIRDDGFRTRASATQINPDDDKNYIIKHRGGDAVLDDNGNKILLIKCFVGPSPDKTEELSVFLFKRIADEQRTVLTEREQERVRRYLAGALDVKDEGSGQGGGGEEVEDKDPDETKDENEQEE